jgi:hypothetical protein
VISQPQNGSSFGPAVIVHSSARMASQCGFSQNILGGLHHEYQLEKCAA